MIFLLLKHRIPSNYVLFSLVPLVWFNPFLQFYYSSFSPRCPSLPFSPPTLPLLSPFSPTCPFSPCPHLPMLRKDTKDVVVTSKGKTILSKIFPLPPQYFIPSPPQWPVAVLDFLCIFFHLCSIFRIFLVICQLLQQQWQSGHCFVDMMERDDTIKDRISSKVSFLFSTPSACNF